MLIEIPSAANPALIQSVSALVRPAVLQPVPPSGQR